MFIISLGKHINSSLTGFAFLQHLDVAELHRDLPSQASKTINEAHFCEVLYEANIIHKTLFFFFFI